MPSDKFDIDSFNWAWQAEYVRCWVGRLSGMDRIPRHFVGRAMQRLKWDFPPNSHVWSLGRQLATYLMQRLQPLAPVDVGADALITGDFDGPPDCHPTNTGLKVRRWFLYSNGFRYQVALDVDDKDIGEPYLSIKHEIERLCKQRLLEILFEQMVPGNMKANPSRWNVKTQIFISYRGKRDRTAFELFHLLGNYGDKGVFLPRMDRVDMQAGNWMDQLMKMIGECEVFMPLLTPDYLHGPFSRPELDQALRLHFQDKTKRVVPLLVEGTFGDYHTHFIGGFHIVDAGAGFTDDKVQEIAALCLNLTRNPYE